MFYVKHRELAKLSGRTKQNLYVARKRGHIPFLELGDATYIYDVDDPKVQKFIRETPKSVGDNALAPIIAYRREFEKLRATQKISCARTGTPDYMASIDPEAESALFTSLDDEALDRKKKEKDIEYRDMQIEKGKVALLALTGDLIDRVYVDSYVRKYIGALHQQHLDLASTGVMDDLYSLFKREPDGMKAIKEGEKLLEKALSGILKDATSAMDSNKL